MDKRTILAATLTTALALAGLSTGVAAQDDGANDSLTGVIVVVEGGDGSTEYFLELEDGTRVRLSVGPTWYWGESHPLAPYDGQTVVLGGLHTGGLPSENASDVAKAQAGGDPAFEVRSITIGDEVIVIWGPGRPPWAGGPSVVGESHPGFAGWSHGQARNASDDANTEGTSGGPAVVGEEHPGYEGWSKGQAAKAANAASAAKGANASSAKSNRPEVASAAKAAGLAKAQAAKAGKASGGGSVVAARARSR